MIKQFRARLTDGSVIGPFCKTKDPAFVEAAGLAGFDFVILDLEHGPVGVETIEHLVRAAECAGVVPIVRTKEDRLSSIGEALDVGAAGIQAPQIASREAAERIVSHAKFAPAGERGVCRFVRAAGYSTIERGRYFKEANETLVVLQLEGTEAIEQLDTILQVEGVDVVFIGPYDLSQSLGVSGEIDHPDVVSTMMSIVKRCAERRICVGTFVDTPENLHRWQDAGVRYLSYSVDVGIYAEACSNIVATFRR